MATAAAQVEGRVKRIPKRRGTPRLVVVHGGKELGAEEGAMLTLSASARMRARQLQRRLERSQKDNPSPERQSVAIAMLAVEERLVKAFSVLGRSTPNPGPRHQAQHGVAYMMESVDKWAEAVAGSGWLSQEPPDPPATPNEVDASDEALEWLAFLDRETANIVSAGARSKRGDVRRRISWIRVKQQNAEFAKYTADRLKKMYDGGLRQIAGRVRL